MIGFNAKFFVLAKDYSGLKQRSSGAHDAPPVKVKVMSDPVPTERCPLSVPAIGLADNPKQDQPLRSVESRSQERINQAGGDTNKRAWLVGCHIQGSYPESVGTRASESAHNQAPN
jgi:hypothetical protein